MFQVLAQTVFYVSFVGVKGLYEDSSVSRPRANSFSRQLTYKLKGYMKIKLILNLLST